ncbi:HTH-type transcriptional repressor CsiR [Corynebacterium occultum]|uniref:HTH-type transcriptional repressor CsiR n=1 Tax=Corynebacterium occultum TaxID=2675219 RepID=A0A6B8W837_9CORY|nr:GntR family transcriptional regulator [Corynebacterium occultum]QGU08107.1 HTH-type transcriptional repressor CsiR [Corynebacterium occultum]
MAGAGTRVLEALRELILSGAWQPGTRLQPTHLAKQLDTSTTVIRESLVQLSGNGLVVSQPNRGFFLRELKLQELVDLTELRIQTETLALKLAIERGDLDWESELIALHHQLTRTPLHSPEDPNRMNLTWQTLHKAFHLKLLEACDCEPMLKIASDLFDSTELYRCWAAQHVTPDARDVAGEHQEILDAVLTRDRDKAGAALRVHYETTVQVLLAAGLTVEATR